MRDILMPTIFNAFSTFFSGIVNGDKCLERSGEACQEMLGSCPKF